MWLFSWSQSSFQLLCNNMDNFRRNNQITKSQIHQHQWYLVIVGILYMIGNIDAYVTHHNGTTYHRYYMPIGYYKGSKYSINELLNGKFTSKISNDIDMDPCKASESFN